MKRPDLIPMLIQSVIFELLKYASLLSLPLLLSINFDQSKFKYLIIPALILLFLQIYHNHSKQPDRTTLLWDFIIILCSACSAIALLAFLNEKRQLINVPKSHLDTLTASNAKLSRAADSLTSMVEEYQRVEEQVAFMEISLKAKLDSVGNIQEALNTCIAYSDSNSKPSDTNICVSRLDSVSNLHRARWDSLSQRHSRLLGIYRIKDDTAQIMKRHIDSLDGMLKRTRLALLSDRPNDEMAKNLEVLGGIRALVVYGKTRSKDAHSIVAKFSPMVKAINVQKCAPCKPENEIDYGNNAGSSVAYHVAQIIDGMKIQGFNAPIVSLAPVHKNLDIVVRLGD